MNVEPQTGNRKPRLEVRGKLGSKLSNIRIPVVCGLWTVTCARVHAQHRVSSLLPVQHIKLLRHETSENTTTQQLHSSNDLDLSLRNYENNKNLKNSRLFTNVLTNHNMPKFRTREHKPHDQKLITAYYCRQMLTLEFIKI